MDSQPTTAFPWHPPYPGAAASNRQSESHVPAPSLSQLVPATTDHNAVARKTQTEPGPNKYLPRLPTLAALAGKNMAINADSAVMEIWEGVVLKVDIDAQWMDVTLEAKTSQIPPHTGRIDLEWVSNQDLDILRAGAVFYLTLYKQTLQGTIRNAQELRFRRRPGWSKDQMDIVAKDAAAIAGKLKPRPRSE